MIIYIYIYMYIYIYIYHASTYASIHPCLHIQPSKRRTRYAPSAKILTKHGVRPVHVHISKGLVPPEKGKSKKIMTRDSYS